MKDKYNLIITIIFLVLSFILGVNIGLKKSKQNITTKTTTETITLYDTVKIESIVYTPKPYKEEIYINTIDTIYEMQKIDTLEILKEFTKTYFYADTLKNDTSAFIVVFDKITNNKISERNWEFINRRPTYIQTTTNHYTSTRTWNVGVGGVISGNGTMLDYGVGVHVRHKQINYMVNYIISNKSIQGGIYYDFLK